MSDRFKFRVFIPDENRYMDNRFDNPVIDGNGNIMWCYLNQFGHWEHHKMEDVVIEQCTGAKDKNGKLIYEGDIVLGSWNTKLIVFWDAVSVEYRVKPVGGGGDREFHYFSDIKGLDDGTISYRNFEIIGNIHEMEVEK